MGLRENDQYRTHIVQMVKDWEREIWPTMKECGFTRETAFISYLLLRVEQSVENIGYEDEQPAPEKKEPWQ